MASLAFTEGQIIRARSRENGNTPRLIRLPASATNIASVFSFELEAQHGQPEAVTNFNNSDGLTLPLTTNTPIPYPCWVGGRFSFPYVVDFLGVYVVDFSTVSACATDSLP